MTLLTLWHNDKQSNGSRAFVEAQSNRSCNYCLGEQLVRSRFSYEKWPFDKDENRVWTVVASGSLQLKMSASVRTFLLWNSKSEFNKLWRSSCSSRDLNIYLIRTYTAVPISWYYFAIHFFIRCQPLLAVLSSPSSSSRHQPRLKRNLRELFFTLLCYQWCNLKFCHPLQKTESSAELCHKQTEGGQKAVLCSPKK